MDWLVLVEAAPAVRTAGAVVIVALGLSLVKLRAAGGVACERGGRSRTPLCLATADGGRSSADGCGLLSKKKEGERERDRGDRLEDGE